MTLAGLEVKIDRSAVYAFVIMVIVLTIVTALIAQANGDLAGSSFIEVILVAVGATVFYCVAQVIHMLGHALAAWLTGYPKRGMWFLAIFAMSLYPPDEPPLPDRVHIIRSFGGVVAFGLVLIFAVLLWVSTRSAPQWTIRYLTSYMLVMAVIGFAVSAFIMDGVMFLVRQDWRKPPDENMPR
jgi:hypothetical protein